MPNTTEDYRLAIESALTNLLWHDGVRQEVGLAGLSQVWDEDPAWYFWLRGVPGALLLRLIACEEVGGGSHATFLVHHFRPPAADREIEGLLARGIFDAATGTPVFERRREVYHLFIDGEIGVSLAPGRQLHLACCSWREGEGTATRALFHVLMEALVFGSRVPPVGVLQGRPGPGIETLFAVFDRAFFRCFLGEVAVGLNPSRLRPPPMRWRQMASASGTCTAHGTCGCRH